MNISKQSIVKIKAIVEQLKVVTLALNLSNTLSEEEKDCIVNELNLLGVNSSELNQIVDRLVNLQ